MKTSRLFLLAAFSIAATLTAQAEAQTTTPPATPTTPVAPAHARGDFSSHKATMLAHIDERAQALATMRTCVAAANTKSDLKACHVQNRSAMHPSHTPA